MPKNANFLLLTLTFLFIIFWVLCGGHDSERYRSRVGHYKYGFVQQVDHFEQQKVITHQYFNEGLLLFAGLSKKLEKPISTDKEFQKLYKYWGKVHKEVYNLVAEFEKLKIETENLFQSLRTSNNSLKDDNRYNRLNDKIDSAERQYYDHLHFTAGNLGALEDVYYETRDIIKAVEISIVLGEIDYFHQELDIINVKVGDIMNKMDKIRFESDALFEVHLFNF